MKKEGKITNRIILKICVSAIIFLCVVPSGISVSSGDDYKIVGNSSQALNESQQYHIYSRCEIPHNDKLNMIAFSNETTTFSPIETMNGNASKVLSGGLMNSSWPMYCHDTHHTGRSPYTTSNNPPGVMKWCLPLGGYTYGSPAIDTNGTIYIGGWDFFAISSNGTLKWKYNTNLTIESCPAIDKNGIIYIGTSGGFPLNYLYAFYPNGTVKWAHPSGEDICSSPVIGDDGTIFYGGHSYSINALYPDGTLKWRYQTNNVVLSSPAIGDDGTVYCGCHDTYLYALYPDNGTLKWKFPTGDWIRVSPCIADDGTIYCVSLDGYLYAICPNGTMKWKTSVGAGTSPTIGPDGMIYAGWSYLCAVNPVNGSVKWVFNPSGTIEGGTPCTSKDGTIYFGTSSGGDIMAVNPNGTEKWRTNIGECDSAPAIGDDGTIYIGSNGLDHCFVYAFGRGLLRAEANGPYTGVTNTSLQFKGTIYGGIPPYTYHWDFGDSQTAQEQSPVHVYAHAGTYTATFSVTDNKGNQSNDTASVTVHYAPPKIIVNKPVFGVYLMNIRILPFPGNVIAFGPITFKVDAYEEPFGINRVEFLVDGKMKATDTKAPYIYIWRAPSFAIHNVDIIAYDNSGNSTDLWMEVIKFF